MRNLLSLFFSLCVATSALADAVSVEKVLANYQETMSAVEDVRAKASLDLQLTVGYFPYSERLEGRYYYKHPNRHRLEFEDAPSYFDKAPNMFSWDLPSPDKYRMKLKGPYGKGKSKVYQVLFLPKNADSSTQSILCTFAAGDWRLLEQDTSYRDGGTIALDFNYLDTSNLPVLDKVSATVSIPAYSLSGNALISFEEQKVNEGLERGIFKKANGDP